MKRHATEIGRIKAQTVDTVMIHRHQSMNISSLVHTETRHHKGLNSSELQ